MWTLSYLFGTLLQVRIPVQESGAYKFSRADVFCIHVRPLHYCIQIECHLIYYINYSEIYEVRAGVVGWGTVLQAGRSRVRFPMVSLEFFIDIILPAAL